MLLHRGVLIVDLDNLGMKKFCRLLHITVGAYHKHELQCRAVPNCFELAE